MNDILCGDLQLNHIQ